MTTVMFVPRYNQNPAPLGITMKEYWLPHPGEERRAANPFHFNRAAPLLE